MDGPTTRTATTALVFIVATALIIHTLTSSGPSSNVQSSRSQKKNSKTRHKNKKARDDEAPQYVTGLVNIGNTCFMNAVLQALASLPSLRSYLEARKEVGHDHDSVTLALCETIEMLSTLHRRPTSKRLVRMVSTVKAKAAHVLTSQQQDAQELFQILSSQLSEEREKLDHPATPSLFDSMTMSDFLNSPSSPSSAQPTGMRPNPSLSVMSSSLSRNQMNSTSRERNDFSSLSRSYDLGHDNNKEREEDVIMTASLIQDKNEQEKFTRAKSPFMGLLASRVSCVDCGYTAAIRHSTFDNLSLTVPLQYSCSLEDCLDSFINLDTITDFNCRKCTVANASKDLERKIEQGRRSLAEMEKRQVTSDGTHSKAGHGRRADQSEVDGDYAHASGSRSSKRSSSGATTETKISLKDMEMLKEKVDQCLANNIEMDLSPLELTPVRSKKTTKHSMIAKPPQALCLHLNRSMFTASGQMAKNPCKVIFGDRLDFTRFTTSGHLTTVATKSMSRRGSIASVNIKGEADAGSSSRFELGLGVGMGLGVGAASTFPRRASINQISVSSPLLSSNISSSNVKHESKTPQTNGHEKRGSKKELVDDQVMYKLWAVIVHLGSHNSGHFVTYRRIPSNSGSSASSSQSPEDVDDIALSARSEKWWRISDEDVQIVDWSLVRNAEAYMLFFEKEIK